MPNSIFFSQKGTKNSQFAADCKSKYFKYKNWMCNAQIPKAKLRKYTDGYSRQKRGIQDNTEEYSRQKDKNRGRVVINKSLNKLLIF